MFNKNRVGYFHKKSRNRVSAYLYDGTFENHIDMEQRLTKRKIPFTPEYSTETKLWSIMLIHGKSKMKLNKGRILVITKSNLAYSVKPEKFPELFQLKLNKNAVAN